VVILHILSIFVINGRFVAIIQYQDEKANAIVAVLQQFLVAAANIWMIWVGPDRGPNMRRLARQRFWWLIVFLHIWLSAADMADPHAGRSEATAPDLGPQVQIEELEDDIPLEDLDHP
jgi:hypothetical protein